MKIVLASFFFLLCCGLPFLLSSKKTEPIQPKEETTKIAKDEFSFKDDLKYNIDTLFQNAYDRDKFAGAAVSIVYRDSVIYTNYFGTRSSESKKLINKETVFRIGSLSKGFSGILAGMLVKEGYIEWDTKLTECMPNFQLSNEKYAQQITFSHLLSHSAGFPYHSFTNLVEDGLSLESIMGEFKKLKNIDLPGTTYSYQNAAFSINGLMVEKETGESYTDLMRKKIFEPLNMRNTSYSYEDFISGSNYAFPQHLKTSGWQNDPINKKYYNAVPAGGINTSIGDMTKWMKLLLGNYPELITQNTINEVFTPIVDTKVNHKYYKYWSNFDHSYYGRGWRILTFSSNSGTNTDTLIHHGGQVNGFRSEIAIHPKEKFGICVLFNSSSELTKTCIPYILEQSRANLIIKDKIKLDN